MHQNIAISSVKNIARTLRLGFILAVNLGTVNGQNTFPEVPADSLILKSSARPTLEPIPSAPSYHKTSSWALLPSEVVKDTICARPGHPFAFRPKGFRARTLTTLDPSSQADIFFVHPTMFLEGDGWNADVLDEDMNDEVDFWPIRHQASAFSGAGRLFAPRYRQAHIRVFDLGDSLSWAAAAIAYSDVKRAFQHYLNHWNDGRPIILAGHSQGSFHGRTLLQEFFDGKDLAEQLVAAYLPGMDMYDDEFEHIELCQSPADTQCLCTWMTYGKGYMPEWLTRKQLHEPERQILCIHPVSWTSLGTSHGRKQHLGVVRPSLRISKRQAISAQIRPEGVLWIDPPHVLGGRWLQRDNWHSGDINLFWVNVYQNAMERTICWHQE